MSAAEVTRIRLDRLLVYLRFVRTRSAARSVIGSGVVRLNRNRVLRVSENIAVGDVLTMAIGDEVRVIEVLQLPDRRTSPALAKSLYREIARH